VFFVWNYFNLSRGRFEFNLQPEIQLTRNIVRREIQNKCSAVLQKNSGYKTMKKTSKILDGQEVSKDGLPEDINEDDITYFK